MTDPPKIGPDRDEDDGSGADTQLRFRYQAIYAAHIALMLLRPSSEFVRVMCEQHEDILLVKTDGSFIGIQVKTKKAGLGPFRSTDEAVVEAIRSFISLHVKYRGKFNKFILVSSTNFTCERNDGNNLVYLLRLFREGSTLDPQCSRYVEKICEGQPFDRDSAIEALARVEVDAEVPGLIAAEAWLTDEVSRLEQLEGQTPDVVRRATDALINRMLQCSALPANSPESIYLTLTRGAAAARLAVERAGKLTSRDQLLELFDDVVEHPALLSTGREIDLVRLSKGTARLKVKMERGGVPDHSIRTVIDHKALVEALLIRWYYERGEKPTNKAVDHLCTLVKSVCDDVLTELEETDLPYGKRMLIEVRRRLREHLREDGSAFLGCRYEHLSGLLGMLTERCTIWWGPEFNLPTEVID